MTDVHLDHGKYDFTPFYMAKFSEQAFEAANRIDADGFGFFLRCYLLCICVEVGAKAHLLFNNNTETRKNLNKVKLSHDLDKLLRELRLKANFEILDSEIASISGISSHFRNKALEYPDGNLMKDLGTGRRGFDGLPELLSIAERIVLSIRKSNYFNTSETTSSA